MSQGIQTDTLNHSDEYESEDDWNPVPSNRPLQMSQEILSDPSSNHPDEHESKDISNPMSQELREPTNHPDAYDYDILDGIRKDHEESKKYLEIYLPLYAASLRCDWKAAEDILDKNQDMELVRCKITENGETALHIAASAKAPKEKVDEFVKNLVERMTQEDLELRNYNYNSALYLAAAAGNIEPIKIMMKKNPTLDTIPGDRGMPLYVAVLFGNEDVALYLYECSRNLHNKGWDYDNRRLLLEKCVESDMFDIALKIVESYYRFRRSNNLFVLLARKPEAFHENKSSYTVSNIIKRTIKSAKKYPYLERSINLFRLLARKHEASHEKKSSNTESNEASHEKKYSKTESNMIRRTIKSVSAFIGYKAGTPVKQSDALPLLRFLWGDILKDPNREIDDILKGPPDSIKSGLGRIAQNIQLKQRFFSHLDKLDLKTRKIMNGDGTEKEKVSKLHDLVSKYVVDMHSETQSLIKKANTTDEYQALELQKLISEFIVKLHHETKKELADPDVDDKYRPRRLQNLISNHIKKIRAKTEKKMHAETEIRDTHSSRVMFIAAEVGNTNFLLELIHTRPDLIWQVDDNRLSIFHIAVKHRHEGIYNLLYEIGSMKDMVTTLTDNDGNNMLHLAAMRTRKKNLENVIGAALQMQRELLWFKEVERMIPPYLRESKNKDGFTPRELFTKEHQNLIEQGEKWMKSTANQCMVVATLIATIVFAAAFTVPGGYDQNDGIPMFKRKLSFVAFVVADAISLSLSSASILIFLSFYTSRYAEDDFVASSPMKLMSGLVTLFLSIGAMMVTFSVSFFVLYHKEMKWIPIFISLFAVIPAILYVALQFHLLVDIVRSTYGGKYLFKPARQVLFYQNPRF